MHCLSKPQAATAPTIIVGTRKIGAGRASAGRGWSVAHSARAPSPTAPSPVRIAARCSPVDVVERRRPMQPKHHARPAQYARAASQQPLGTGAPTATKRGRLKRPDRRVEVGGSRSRSPFGPRGRKGKTAGPPSVRIELCRTPRDRRRDRCNLTTPSRSPWMMFRFSRAQFASRSHLKPLQHPADIHFAVLASN